MPAEGAPESTRERIALGRSQVVAQLTTAVAPAVLGGRQLPDPELTARLIVTTADELVRLVLTQPREYPVDRVLAHADWLLERLEAHAEARWPAVAG